MNIRKSEEHNLLVRAALVDASGNPGLTYSTLQTNGFLLPNGQMNRVKVMAFIKKNGAYSLRNLPGVGKGTYYDIIRMLLETV
jgi:hypothetical protein